MRSVLLIVAVLAAVAQASCGTYTNCYDCNYYGYGCGWDSLTGVTGTCRDGTSSGPTVGVAVGTWYYGTSSVCPCSTRTTCYQCTRSSCGWDNSSIISVCKSGSSLPAGTPSNSWRTYGGDCTCSMRDTTCTECIAYSGCGWDTTLGSTTAAVCRAGTVSGPTVGTVTSSNWNYNSCPCSTYTTCGQCTYGSGCGWTTATAIDSCVSGSSSGPTGTTQSTGWYYFSSSCANYNWAPAFVAAAALATWLLIVVIIIPLCICICIIACIVRAVTRKNTEVVVVQSGQPGMSPAYVQA